MLILAVESSCDETAVALVRDGREVLTDAMEHPEQYQSLVVRVSGFSAFYVTLDRDVQMDILHRTQQE